MCLISNFSYTLFYLSILIRILWRLTCRVLSLLSNVGCWWLTGLSCFFLYSEGPPLLSHHILPSLLACQPTINSFPFYELGQYHVDSSNVEIYLYSLINRYKERMIVERNLVSLRTCRLFLSFSVYFFLFFEEKKDLFLNVFRYFTSVLPFYICECVYIYIYIYI